MPRILPLFLAICFIAIDFAIPESIEAQTTKGNVANLQQQLESGLKARRPEEFAFIKKVVTMVGDNELPLKLVKGTFQWTRQNPQAREYPFFYFQRALRERAKKLGITV